MSHPTCRIVCHLHHLATHADATRLPCVSMTPLGRPVVPLEYGRMHTSSVGSRDTTRSDFVPTCIFIKSGSDLYWNDFVPFAGPLKNMISCLKERMA